MNDKRMTQWGLFFLFFSLLISSCSSTTVNNEKVSKTQVTTSEDMVGETPELGSIAQEGTSIPAEASAVVFEATPVPTRQVPDDFDWREAPIMPVMSDTIIEIYKNGIEQGRNPANFSTIGDCQGIPFVFMGPIGRRELQPADHEQYLWDAIDYFDTSFEHESISVRGGFTAASVLNPMQADPRQCKPGETPLTCEYRLHNPAFVFITLENWRDPESVHRYESYLREIVAYVIQHGSVPILITKADVSETKEGIQVINPAIAKIAYEFDVPLVNFRRAAQYLENYGIDPEREGFHLSQEGYNRKNILALQALYFAWQKIETEMASISPSEETSPMASQPAATRVPAESAPMVEMLANPNCPEGCVFFGLAKSQDGEVESAGVFAYEYGSKELIQILPTGFDLQDIHADGKRLLVNWKNFLYTLDLRDTSSELVSTDFYWLGQQSAYWAGKGTDAEIIQINADSPYKGDENQAIHLFPSGGNSKSVFFESGLCESPDLCTSEGIYQQLPDEAPFFLEDTIRPVFSPDGNWYAFLNPDAKTAQNHGNIDYFLMQDPNRGLISRKVFFLPARSGFRVFPDVRTYAFSPQSDKLFIYYDIYSVYFEKSLRFETFLLDLNTRTLEEYGEMDGNSGSFKPKLVWSPDGEKVLLFLTDKDDDGYSLGIYETVIDANNPLAPKAEEIYTSQNYFYITQIKWR